VPPDFWAHVRVHLGLAGAALAIALVVAVPAGLFSAKRAAARPLVLGLVNVGRVVPSLAVLTLLLPVWGVGAKTAIAALALLAIPPIAINTDVAIRNIPMAVTDAARGLGMLPRQILWRIEAPLAFPIVLAGTRTAAVEVIASATLATFIGGGGLGEYITTGLQANDTHLLLVGVTAVALLAIASELAFTALLQFAGTKQRSRA